MLIAKDFGHLCLVLENLIDLSMVDRQLVSFCCHYVMRMVFALL